MEKTNFNPKTFALLSAAALAGLAFCLLALFAQYVGLDPNNGWGPKRVAMLEGAYLFTALALVFVVRHVNRRKAVPAALVFIVGQCLFLYYWFGTAGTMKPLPLDATYYFDAQGDAFLQGQVHLLETPDPRLLALPDPYAHAQNEPYRVLDYSLYDGKYYLYWGPFPAVVLAALKLMVPGAYSDAFLSGLFLAGYPMLMALLVWKIKRLAFPGLPDWLAVPAALIGGLLNPVLWITSLLAFCEVAVTAGVFCLLAGVLFALHAMENAAHARFSLAAAGTLLSCAVLSRYNLGPAVAWIAACLAFALLKREGNWRSAGKSLAALGLPLALGLCALLLFNYLRFDSPLEMGVRYQLSELPIRRMMDMGFAARPANIPPNLAAFLFHPLALSAAFPFVEFPLANFDSLAAALQTPERARALVMTPLAGMFATSPFLGLMFLLLFAWRPGSRAAARTPLSLPWLSAVLGGSAALVLISVSAWFFLAMRFLLEFAPLFYLLACAGVFDALEHSKTGELRLAVAGLAAALGLATLVFSLLLGFTGQATNFFAVHNPALFESLAGFFAP